MSAVKRHLRYRLTKAGRYWLLATIGLALTGLSKNINLFLLMGYFLAGLMLINVWLARQSLRHHRPAVIGPPPCFAGERAVWTVTITAGRRSAAGLSIECEAAGVPIRW